MIQSFFPTLALATSLVALALAGYMFWNVIALNRLRKSFFSGKTGMDLETTLHALNNELKDIRESQVILDRDLTKLSEQLGFAVQKVGVVRFNPFGDGGGNFSFSLALLDSHNSGVVITSMYGRQQNRIYSKKIDSGKSESALTEEEQQAVVRARSNNPF